MEIIIGIIIRHLLTAGGAILLEKGITSQSEWEAIGGGIAAAIGIVFSYINKKRLAQS